MNPVLALLLALAPAEAKSLKFPEEIAAVEFPGEVSLTVEHLYYGKEQFQVLVLVRNRNERDLTLLAGDFRCGRTQASLPLLPGSGNPDDFKQITSPAKEADEDFPSASSLLRRVDHVAEIGAGQEKRLSLICRHSSGESGPFVVTLGRLFHTSPDALAVPLDLRVELPEAAEKR